MMKKILKNRVITSILAICMVVSCLPVYAQAANNIYINNDGDILGTDIGEAYTVDGAGNVTKIEGSTAWAMTGDGLQEVSGGSSGGDPNLVTPAPIGGTVSIKSSTIRIGLYYFYSSSRNTSVAAIGLSAVNGNGYKYGYFDSNRVFHEVGSTSETAVSVVKDTNVTTAGGAIGCYHVKLGNTYSSFSEASAAAAEYPDAFPAFYNGTYHVLVGQYQNSAEAEAAQASRGLSGSAFSASNRAVVVTKTGTTKILFEYDGGTNSSLALRPVAASGKPNTKIGEYTYYGDFQFIRTQGENMTVVNFVDIEDYTKGVLPYEMSTSWPIEALKAQALCARTYAISGINNYNSYGFDLTNDTYSQVYRGNTASKASTDTAVEQTKGQYITYNGSLISALYSSSSGGGTESNINVYGNSGHPYLKGVLDPFEQAASSINSYSSWTKTLTSEQLGGKVGLGAIVTAKPTYSETNNCIRIDFTDKNGKTTTVTGDSCRTKLGMNSIHFTIKTDSAGNFVFEGGGWGHNLGMSQFGAYAMAYHYGYTYEYIIGFYFTGVKIATGVV